MDRVVVLFLSIFSFIASVQSYSQRGYDPLREFLKAQKTRSSKNYPNGDAFSEYSPFYMMDQFGLKDEDQILSLPGQPEVNFSQYSGYVTVDPNSGRALFYWLTESEDSSSKPLVLWLNGGPGCSSIGNGAMTELGPFRVNPDAKTLCHNKHSWNTVANILFLDSPAGVGFSYSNTSSDYITGDSKTAADSYTFLVNWFKRFPEYKTRDFYITGESYAGHYVPQFAQLILKNNKIMNQTAINLKGIAIGNGYIDYEDSHRGRFDYYWTHALISDEIHSSILKNCNFSSVAALSEACTKFMEVAYNLTTNIYFYDIYAPLCSTNSTAPSLSQFDPCSENYVNKYLNTPEVQKSLHANVTGNIPGSWNNCNAVSLYMLIGTTCLKQCYLSSEN